MVERNGNGGGAPGPSSDQYPLRVRYLIDAYVPEVDEQIRSLIRVVDERPGYNLSNEVDDGFNALLTLVETQGVPWRLRKRIEDAQDYWEERELGGAREELELACNWLAKNVKALAPWYWAVRSFQGLWQPVSTMIDGVPKDHLENRRVLIAGDSYFVVDDEGDGLDTVRQGIFRFTSQKIDAIPALGRNPQKVVRGIYEMGHRTMGPRILRLCFTHNPLRPTDLSGRDKSGCWLTDDVFVAPCRKRYLEDVRL